MTKIVSTTLLLITLFWTSLSPAEDVSAATLKSLPGLQESVAWPSGKFDFIVLDFWASWCGPCQESMPFLEKQSQSFKNLPIQWLSINEDEDPKDALKFLRENKLESSLFLALRDENKKLAHHLDIDSLPRLYILDSNYKIVFSERGFTPEKKARIEKQFQTLFKKGQTKN